MSQTVREIAELQIKGHVLASTEALGDDLDRKLREMMTLQECWPETVQDARKTIADLRAQLQAATTTGEKLAKALDAYGSGKPWSGYMAIYGREVYLQEELQAATLRVEAAELIRDTLDELQLKCATQERELQAAGQERDEAAKQRATIAGLYAQIQAARQADQDAWKRINSLQQLADEWGREVERLKAAIQQVIEVLDRNFHEFSDLCSMRRKAEDILEAALHAPAATPPAQEHPDTALADRIVQMVAEIPDRFSPEDDPRMMLVRDDELRDIILSAIDTARTAPEAQQ